MTTVEWPGVLKQLGLTWERARQWSVLLGQFFTAQTVTQLLGLAAGLLLVRYMPIGEFALYTLALSVIGFFTFLTDLGAGNSLLYFFHESRKSDLDFSAFVRAVLSLRAAAFVVGAVIVAWQFPRIAGSAARSSGQVAAVTTGIVLCVGFQITAAISVLLLRIEGRFVASYRAEIAGGAVRLVGSAIMVAGGWMIASLGILTSALASAAMTLISHRRRPTASSPSTTRSARKRVLRYLLPTLPSGLYFSIQGPLIVWLATYFGGVTNVAQVGAMARLAMVFSIFNSLVGVLFLPRLAHVTDDRIYRTRYLQYSAFLAAIGLGLVGAATLAPAQLLWVIGPNYSGLQRELLLSIATAAISLLSLFAVSVTLARAWTRWNVVLLALHATGQVALVGVLPLDTTAGVLLFGLLSATIGLALQTVNNMIGFVAPEAVRWNA